MNRTDVLTVLAGTLVALAAAAEARTSRRRPTPYRPLSASAATLATASPGAGAPGKRETDACAPLHVELPHIDSPESPAVPPIEDSPTTGREAMATFYEHLALVLRGRAKDHARIGVYGDSNGTRDLMTGEMRRVVQKRYGDAGHGFIALGFPWKWYSHMDLRHEKNTETWITFTVTSAPTMDGFYGHGLIAAHSLQGGATTWIATAGDDAPIGRTASRVDVHFLKGPELGTFEVRVDKETLATVDTHAPTHGAGFATVRFPDAAHKVEIVVRRGHAVRLFGAALERDVPGVIVDGLGVGMLNCRWMLRDDPRVFVPTLAHRNYDLLVFHLGTMTRPADYAPCMEHVLARLRAALPATSILIMSPPDFPDFDAPKDKPRSAPWVNGVRDAQRAFAASHGLAFFDFREAMGGDASMSRFDKDDMTVGDTVHFNEKGAAYMGDRVVYAVWRDFSQWLTRHPRAGCDAGSEATEASEAKAAPQAPVAGRTAP